MGKILKVDTCHDCRWFDRSGLCWHPDGVGVLTVGYEPPPADCPLPDYPAEEPQEREEAEANARLIAAAPEMLEALRSLRRDHDECEDAYYSCPKSEEGCADDRAGDDCTCGADRHNAIIDAAIAKATGEGE